ncbi:hypothetical protein C8F01DRAFT_1100739 [Mycena amicta]|nr:hypothetical protein C8F01DRAFT_1100739 [Mycena amicta]
MSAHDRKNKKPPACDACKARRVLCHSQLNGEPCPRCIEKNIICTTTPVARGRPRKHPIQGPSSPLPVRSLSLPAAGHSHLPSTVSVLKGSVPDLGLDFIQHCFEAIKYVPQYAHPLLGPTKTNIKATLSEVDWDLHRLTPQARVLAICIICAGTLVSFHPFILNGNAPESFADEEYFGINDDDEEPSNMNTHEKATLRARLRHCGISRASLYRALRDDALRAAWEAGVLLQATNENAASCYFLDMLEQIDLAGSSRPWGVAYISHIRVLAPLWHSMGYTATDASDWAGFLMDDALISGRNRSPVLITANDQLLLAGPEPPPLEAILSSLQKSAQNPSLSLIWTITRPVMYHVITLARQLSETVAGDYPRLDRLSEAAVLNLTTSLTLMQSIVLILLERVDSALLSSVPAKETKTRTRQGANASTSTRFSLVQPPAPSIIDNTSVEGAARAAAHSLTFGFTGLVLPLYRELEHRETSDAGLISSSGSMVSSSAGERTRERLRLMHVQVHEMAIGAAKLLARGFRYLPRVHYAPMRWSAMCAWAEFSVEEAEVRARQEIGEEEARDLATFEQELWLLTYSLDTSSNPQAVTLLDRIEAQLKRVNGQDTRAQELFDERVLGNMFLPVPLSGGWMPHGGEVQGYLG